MDHWAYPPFPYSYWLLTLSPPSPTTGVNSKPPFLSPKPYLFPQTPTSPPTSIFVPSPYFPPETSISPAQPPNCFPKTPFCPQTPTASPVFAPSPPSVVPEPLFSPPSPCAGQGAGRTWGPGSLGGQLQPFLPGPGERPEGPGAGGKEEEEKEEERADISWRLRPAGRDGPGRPWRSEAEVRGRGTATGTGLGGRRGCSGSEGGGAPDPTEPHGGARSAPISPLEPRNRPP